MDRIEQAETNKSLKEAVSRVVDYAREQARKNRTPIYIEDESGLLIKEYPDGHKTRIVCDEQGEREIPLA